MENGRDIPYMDDTGLPCALTIILLVISMKNKFLLLSLAIMGFSVSIYAAQPLRRTIPVLTTSGDTLKVTRIGDERFAYYVTEDGYALLADKDGRLCYALRENDNLRVSNIEARAAMHRTTRELRFLSENGVKSTQAHEVLSRLYPLPAMRQTRGFTASGNNGMGEYGEPGKGVVSSIGAPSIPVLMVEFADRKFLPENTTEKFMRLLNEPGYAEEEYTVGSVKDYFAAQSNGLFSPSFEVVGKVTVENSYAYYGENYSNGGIDMRSSTFIQEALAKAVAQGVDFSRFKVNGTDVPLVSIYFAGPGEQSSFEAGSENYLWAHFAQRSFSAGGVRIASYFVGNEILQGYKDEEGNVEYEEVSGQRFPVPQTKKIDGIGIFVHEFSHALGLPDFYYTGSNATVQDTLLTPQFWSVMDYGNYWSDGYAPVGYNAYERSLMGWLNAEVLDETAANLKLMPFGREQEGATAYVLPNQENPAEFFLLENRRTGTWYPKAMGHGMLISHVDYDAAKWSGNSVNNDPNRQRFEIIPADNDRRQDGPADVKGDLFRNGANFTDDSTPAAKVNTGTGFLNRPLYGINEQPDNSITFSYLDASLTAIERPNSANEGNAIFRTIDGRYIGAKRPAAPGLYLMQRNGKTTKTYIQ